MRHSLEAEGKLTNFYIRNRPGENPSRFSIRNSTTQQNARTTPTGFYIRYRPGETSSSFYIRKISERGRFRFRTKYKEEEEEK